MKKILPILVVGILVLSGLGSVALYDEKTENKQVVDIAPDGNDISITLDGYIDITVGEAWVLLNDPSNGIQIPIDVRFYGEWYSERIDTPYPEDPRHYWVEDLKNENGLQGFMSLYNGKEIVLYCRSGGRSRTATQILVDEEFNGTIYNMLGGITAWKDAGFPTKIGNQAPYQPDKPSGPITGNTGISYTYYTSTIDPDNDAVKYGWDWDGDSIVDEWTTNFYESGTIVNASHSWETAGTYNIEVVAEDGVGDRSDFSLVLTIVINNPPNKPTISGPTSGKVGTEYEYIFLATDPNGDDLYYYIDWGDNSVEEWIGPYGSDEEVTLKHTWTEKGTYAIKAKTKDIYGAESDWGTLEVGMPKNKAINPLPRLFDLFIEQFPLLEYLLGFQYLHWNLGGE